METQENHQETTAADAAMETGVIAMETTAADPAMETQKNHQGWLAIPPRDPAMEKLPGPHATLETTDADAAMETGIIAMETPAATATES
jgi:hypothetical protein